MAAKPPKGTHKDSRSDMSHSSKSKGSKSDPKGSRKDSRSR